jgi:ribulose-bisphosphate carboxylase small chain
MASIAATSHAVAPAAFAAAVPRVATSESSTVRAFTGLRSAPLIARESAAQSLGVQNGSRVSCMQVWAPTGNKKFETLSYLPPLTSDQIAKQIDYMLANNSIPCLEFDLVGYVSRDNFAGSGYYDGRYWTMWKLPMFGCTDAASVLREIAECKKAYPNAFIRVLGFDNVRQVQVSGFLVQRPDA